MQKAILILENNEIFHGVSVGYKADSYGEIVFNSDYPDGNPRKLLDSSKITSYGWEPRVDISKGLELTYDWYLKNIDN